MYEAAAIWTLTGSDGTVSTFNDGSSGMYIEAVSGWDSPNIRTSVYDLPEDDGATAGLSYLGQRPWSLSGKIGANLTATARNAAVVALQRSIRGLRAGATAKSTPTGLPAMQSSCILVGFRLSGGFVKDFQLQFISADPRAYSQAAQSGTGSGAGAISYVCTNAGNFPPEMTFTLTGPVTNAVITNATTGDVFYIDTAIAAGHTVIISTAARTILDGATNMYQYVRFPSSVWWGLAPGANTVTLTGTARTGATTLLTAWRDAWA